MKKNRKKIVALVICFIVLIILFYVVIHTYAIFNSEVAGTTSIKNAKWNIFVNDVRITGEDKTEFVISEIEHDTNEHVKPGNIAPGTKGAFYININSIDTEVSVKYNITFDREFLNESDVKIVSIHEVNSDIDLIKTDNDTYTDTIMLDDIKNNITKRIKVEIEWLTEGEYEDQDASMASRADSKLEIPIIVQVTQYLGEEINEFTRNKLTIKKEVKNVQKN